MAGIVAMQRRQIGLDDARQPLARRGLFGDFAPALGRAVHRIGKSFDHQRLARIEMGVEAAMGQARLLHQVGDADAMRALFAKPHRSLLHDPRVGFLLVLFRIAHGADLIGCLQSYNSSCDRKKLHLFRPRRLADHRKGRGRVHCKIT
jgi:hypothetical protein